MCSLPIYEINEVAVQFHMVLDKEVVLHFSLTVAHQPKCFHMLNRLRVREHAIILKSLYLKHLDVVVK